MKPGSPEWKNRVNDLARAELNQPLRPYYMSFADEEGFRGAVIVEARGPVTALAIANILGINPGGQVVTIEIPPGSPMLSTPEAWNRLLSRQDVENFWGGAKRLGDLTESEVDQLFHDSPN